MDMTAKTFPDRQALWILPFGILSMKCTARIFQEVADGKRARKSPGISNQIDALETKAKTCEEIMDFTKKYEKLEGLTEEFIDEMVEKITVYEDNRIEIVWRYGDEFENLG